MSELPSSSSQESASRPSLAAERRAEQQAEIDKISAKLAEQQAKSDLLESWGAFDDIAPEKVPEGEITYDEYLSRRPSEGIVRSENGYREASTGKFSSAEEYNKQQDAGIDSENENLTNKDIKQSYESLSLTALAKEMAEAKARGDVADAAEIESIAKDKYQESVEKSHSKGGVTDDTELSGESSSKLEKELREELKIFEARVARLESIILQKQGLPKIEFSDGSEPTDSEPGSELSQEPNPEPSPDEELKSELSPQGNPDEESGSNLESAESESDSSPESEPNPGEDDSELIKLIPDDELDAILARGIGNPEQPNEEPEVDRQKTKGLVNKVRVLFYTAVAESQALIGRVSAGEITENMSDEDKKEVLRKKRRNKIIGGVGLAVVGGLTAWAVAKGFSAPTDNIDGGSVGDAAGGVGEGFNMTGVDTDASRINEALASGNIPNTEFSSVVTPSDLAGDRIPVPEFSPRPEFTIPSGSGGEALMNSLGVEPSEWYEISGDLLEKFPESFYFENGDVRFMKPGELPVDVQEYIVNRLGL